MGRFFAIALLGILAMGQMAFADARTGQNSPKSASTRSDSESAGRPTLPPPPPGKSTVIGGSIREVDPVRDQFILQVFGGKKMKILYDERTRVYQDGKRIPLRDLHAEGHASVETVLDGTKVFARSVHTLSRAPEGECQGQVLSFNPATRELNVSAALSNEPIQLQVPTDTPIVPSAAVAAASSTTPGLADLVKGTLVSVKFNSGNKGRGVARQIEVLAVPGVSFVFTGNISFLDLHSGLLVIIDPRDGSTYKISFDPARFPVSRKLHQGDTIRATAEFNGTRYVASAITVK